MITGMILAMTVILSYQLFVSWLWKKNNWKTPGSETATTQVSTDTAPTTATTSSRASGSNASSTASTNPATQPTGIRVIGASTTQPAMIGSTAAKDPNYVAAIRFLPQGAAIDSVMLNQFKLEVGKPEPYSFEQPSDLTAEERPLASRNITINGQTFDLANVNWALENSSAGEVTYAVEIGSDTEKLARVRKTIRLDAKPDSEKTSGGYEATVSIAIENLSGASITTSTSFNGPPAPRPETARGPDRSVTAGYDNSGEIELNHHAIEELKPDNPRRDITKSEKTSLPFVWAGFSGTYFDSILRPLPPGKSLGAAPYIKTVEAQSLHVDAQHEHPEVCVVFATSDQTIDAGGSVSFATRLFMGPKARSLLKNDYYSSALIHYDKTLVMTVGICGACAVDWLINFLVWLMVGFHAIFRDWGLAIIGLVVLVRLILHPITKKSQVNMMKMSKMGPEMEKLKKKYGDDKEAIAKAQMEMYKSMGFTPVLGCLPMFLQMPIFISLWQALQSTFELRHAPFLWNFTWIKDLSQPDRLIAFSHPIPLGLFGWHIDAINILPILVAIVSFINMKYTPRPPAATPEAEQQQKMMQWMTLIFPLMFYTFPSGLNIYYLTSTSLGIWEGKRIRAHIKEHEEAEKAGKVIVDASPNSRNRPKKVEARPVAQGGLAGLLARLQDRAEQMRDQGKGRKR